jgi:hypothetical protein
VTGRLDCTVMREADLGILFAALSSVVA